MPIETPTHAITRQTFGSRLMGGPIPTVMSVRPADSRPAPGAHPALIEGPGTSPLGRSEILPLPRLDDGRSPVRERLSTNRG
jgi:hypothetical protein